MIVKKLRDKNNWSQEHLAELCGLNVRTVQRVESGKKASLETLKSLASVFEVEISKLTEEITVIDKKSEVWKEQPWWLRLAFFGVASRRIQVYAEFSLLVFGLLALFAFDSKHIAAGLFMATYFTGLAIRYGDDKRIW
ncbi:helix-turn-helix domain-containing protein [Marinicella litoralis]|uniref:Helix-turn-helix protein n=1 Tax=Marinicella litoralis TaxID=644220 RepID=A0A4R6Y131_9GAMM|nr:helix-turn-helix transcriptional regulator [Marinicella litoralis]TDR23853.1 helix-turn-helix protein [Marinicella litoralis]